MNLKLHGLGFHSFPFILQKAGKGNISLRRMVFRIQVNGPTMGFTLVQLLI